MTTRIGFAGAGVIAARHLGVLQRFADVKVVGVADPLLERAGSQAERCGARAYTDVRDMMDRERPDALYVCVPPFAHGAPEAAAIERGLPFFVEKPLAVDLQTAETIGQSVAARKLVTAVGHHWRYLDTTDEARELLAKTPARLAVGYWLDSTPPPPWWSKEKESGGQMVEQTVHIFDLARLLVGDVDRVYAAASRTDRADFAHADVADVSTATLHFQSGAVGSVSSTCLLRWPHRIGLHLFGDGLAVELSEFEIMVDVGRGRPTRRAGGDPFEREDRAFIDAVQGKENKVRVDYAEALRTHRLATAAARSAREKRVIVL